MNAHPLAALVGPLRYACERDFARLSSVKDLKTPVARAVEAATALVPPETIALLCSALLHVDDAQVETRKTALKQVIAALMSAGVSLPPELEGLSVGGQGQLAQKPGAVLVAETLEEPRAKKEEKTSARKTSAIAPASPSASAKRADKAKKSSDDPAASEEARLLSIAPRAGPLSLPLKSVSWKLNPRLVGILNRKGIQRVGDILFMIPRAYEDRRQLQMISQLRIGERGVTVATVRTAGEVPTRGGRRMFRAVLADASGSIAATYFQSGPWLKARFPIGKRLVLSGDVRASPSGREIPHPEIEPAEDLDAASSIHFNRIVPVYSGFERHEQRTFRELAHRICAEYAHYLEEPLPPALLQELGLVGLSEAIRDIHFPGEEIALEDPHQTAAHQRLAFDELFFLQLGIAAKRQGIKVDPGYAFNTAAERLQRAKSALPFTLTGAQARVVDEILRDMADEEPMHRLLQGDVGSGKTAVAQVTAAIALQDGFQVAVMAPTEILAEQHWRGFQRVLGPLGYKVGLLTSAGTQKEKRLARDEVRDGAVHVAVGTHALIQGEVEFKNLGFVVIDEQHRFGVIQRHALMNKGRRPDVLVMTATPIPRTLSMTLYGDLDLSVIDELPPGRTPIVTRVYVEKARERVYEAMTAELKAGRQAYVVYPLVEESEKVDLADATQGAERIRALFPDYQVGLLHGRMKAEEKEAVMAEFRDNRLQILVCTTVVEVGVDVPNASVMVIEAAERFGLSQLHQLRGRVGRGAAKSFCFLIAGYARSQDSSERLQVMERSTDGFVIAQKDLEIRGPGEFLGTRQSGLPELAVANLTRDGALLNEARERAREIIERDPSLSADEHQGLAKALEERWEGRLALARVG
ncbi:MAG: ATP-dependent DNA helicase RecG [Myxococcaceae bacterium]